MFCTYNPPDMEVFEMQCILCEKPSAAKNFATALGGYKGSYNGKQYEIVSSHGHLFGMPGPEEQVDKELIDQYKSWSIDFLPWDYRDLKFKRKLMKDASDTFNKIRDVAKNCDELVIATDDDPTGEGTLLANEIIEAINLKGVKYYRCFHVDESPKEIQKAMKNLTFLGTDPKTDPDFKKAEFRSKWDYLSMQWIRVFTNYSGDRSVLRQGRLKSYMVWVVGEQLRKISEYQKIPYYQARFRDENGNIYSSKNEEMYEKMGDVPIGKFSTSTIVKEKP